MKHPMPTLAEARTIAAFEHPDWPSDKLDELAAKELQAFEAEIASGRYDCADCGSRLDEGPMLHDRVWLTIARKDEFLCAACICKRLGRAFTASDLTDVPWNDEWLASDSVGTPEKP